MYDIALFIFNRTIRRSNAFALWRSILKVIDHDNRLETHERVLFIRDLYLFALEKACKVGKGTYHTFIKKDGKEYKMFEAVLPMIEKARINPFAFFLFAVEQRRAKKIPPTVTNICTENAIEHFLHWREKNTFRVQACSGVQDLEQQIINQFRIDIRSFVTYQLRKSRACLSNSELYLFSHYSKAMLSMIGLDIKLIQKEVEFVGDLAFDEELSKMLKKQWNWIMRQESDRVYAIINPHLDELYLHRVESLITLLKQLSFNV